MTTKSEYALERVCVKTVKSAAYLEIRQGDKPKRGHLVTLKAPGREEATSAQRAAGRLQEKSEGVLPDCFFDE